MKKYIYMAVAAIAALSSCSSENDPIMGETGKQALTFTASMESGVTRATYNSTAKCASWETTDQISINGKTYNAQSAGLTTTFTAEDGEATLDGGKYKAYFPASMYNSSTVTLPASYTYAEGGFDMPMYAESTTTELSFKNLCGVLAITVPSTEMSTVTSIVVSSDKQMNGVIDNVTADGVLTFASATPLPDANKKVTLTAASPISIPAEGKTFYVPVPANTHNPLLITVSNGTDTKAMVTKKSGGVVVARNTIYSINFNENANAWETKLTLGKSEATSIVIETGVTTSSYSEDGTHKKLNSAGTLWEVLDGTTLKIQTSAAKIKGHGPFGTDGLFDGYSNVETITGLANIDFSEVTDMRWMFNWCSALTSLDLSSFNTSAVTTMKCMFQACLALASLNLSGFNTSAVTDMESMFSGCNALTSLDLSGFNTSAVTTMKCMFSNCSALTSLDLSGFDTSEVTDMNTMFSNCIALTSLDLSGFNTSAVTSLKSMFNFCKALTSLNLSGFNTSEVTDMSIMFNNCFALSSLDLSDNFVMTKVDNKSDMFYFCGIDLPVGDKCVVKGVTIQGIKDALKTGTDWDDDYMTFE